MLQKYSLNEMQKLRNMMKNNPNLRAIRESIPIGLRQGVNIKKQYVLQRPQNRQVSKPRQRKPPPTLGYPELRGQPRYNATAYYKAGENIRKKIKSKTPQKNTPLPVYFSEPAKLKNTKSKTPQKTPLEEWFSGKSMKNIILVDVRSLFPNVKNANFLRVLGFIPRRSNKKNTPLPVYFSEPAKLKNVATLGKTRFSTKNIKKSSPKRNKSPVRVPNVVTRRNNTNNGKGKAPVRSQREKKLKLPNNKSVRPVNVPKPNVIQVKNLYTLRPVDIESHYRNQRVARGHIERIVRNARARTGNLQAWEKAKIALGNQISISSSSSSSPNA